MLVGWDRVVPGEVNLVVKANKRLLGFRVLRAHFGAEVQQLMRVYATL